MRQQRLPRRATRGTIVVLTFTALAAAVASACAGQSRTSRLAPATPFTAPASTAAPDPTSEVLAAYQEFWRVWLEANDPPNPDDPNLERVDTGAQLLLDRQVIAGNRAKGVAYRPANPSRADHKPVVVGLTKERATVRDCALDDGVVVDRATGNVLNADVVTYLWRVTLIRQGGKWKVEDNTRVDKWRGESDCGLGLSGRHSP